MGPFDLLGPLDAGGMGEIWQAVHRDDDGQTPVAIKVISDVGARAARFRAAFQREVEAIARLDHPHVVPVFDAGEVSEAASQATDGRLPAGAPWLAMELLSHGTLSNQTGRLGWRRQRRVLLRLLDALAHAHARGVLHLDLKPANVLIDSDGDPKLADFGLARLVGFDPQQPGVVAGTPHYMAPEQAVGAWQAFAPWTDLYALGCVAWAVATGRPPFRAVVGLREVMAAQVSLEPPSFDPRQPVPPAFERWLRRLLDKRPQHRFRFAADAAWALAQIPVDDLEDSGLGPDGPTEPSTLPPTLAVHMRAAQSAWTSEHARVGLGHDLGNDGVRGDPRVADPPPFPADWRRPTDWLERLQLHGAGLGLFGVRELPFVGRGDQRDQLWAALSDVCRERTPRAVVLRGSGGFGKRRLARWVGERASELGVALSLRSTHDVRGGVEQGLVGMLRHHLRCGELQGEELRSHLDRLTARWPVAWTEREGAALVDTLSAPRGRGGRDGGGRPGAAGGSALGRPGSARLRALDGGHHALFARLQSGSGGGVAGRTHRPARLRLDGSFAGGCPAVARSRHARPRGEPAGSGPAP